MHVGGSDGQPIITPALTLYVEVGTWLPLGPQFPLAYSMSTMNGTNGAAQAAKAQVFDPVRVAAEVDELMRGDTSVAPLVREAMQAIDEALDTHG